MIQLGLMHPPFWFSTLKSYKATLILLEELKRINIRKSCLIFQRSTQKQNNTLLAGSQTPSSANCVSMHYNTTTNQACTRPARVPNGSIPQGASKIEPGSDVISSPGHEYLEKLGYAPTNKQGKATLSYTCCCLHLLCPITPINNWLTSSSPFWIPVTILSPPLTSEIPEPSSML